MCTKGNVDFKMYEMVASNVKKYRIKRGFSIEYLASKAEIKKDYLENLEANPGEVAISIYDLYKISVILQVSIEKFFQ